MDIRYAPHNARSRQPSTHRFADMFLKFIVPGTMVRIVLIMLFFAGVLLCELTREGRHV